MTLASVSASEGKTSAPTLFCAGKPIVLDGPRVMGVLNVTPDSFSDGGEYHTIAAARAKAERMVLEGADIIDVGGESTRPGAETVPLDEELARVIPVIESLARELPVPISIDTCKPEVMRAAADSGVGMINDVRALSAPGALEMAASLRLPVCLMHMLGDPRTMQREPVYRDVVSEVREYLGERIAACLGAGIEKAQIVVDPGFGFGKLLSHNIQLLRRLDEFSGLGVPVLVGLSRKSMIGALLGGVPVGERLHGSVAAAVVAAMKGASIIRVHDVGPTVEALSVVRPLAQANQ